MSQTQDLSAKVRPNKLVINTLDDLTRLGRLFAESGFFKDSRDAAQCTVRILAGMELGHAPFASITGVHLIQGKPTYSAGLIAATVKRSGRYTYRVNEHTDEVCALTFLERDGGTWLLIGESRFTLEDAKKAGLLSNPTWKSYPRNMLFSRALTNGVRWHCPDVFNSPVYTPDELGAEVDGDGEVIVLEPERPQLDAPKAEPPVEPQEPKMSDKRAEAMLRELEKLGYDQNATLELVAETVRKGVLSLTELTESEALQVWNAGRKGSAKRLKEQAALEAKKEPWEVWQTDADAQDYAAALARDHGVFGSGSELMNSWESVKQANKDPALLYREWFGYLSEQRKAKAA